ncbi:synaptosomal-associated protein 29-like [Amphiura filiformis]|uniref:synaptosomal-associated protein 29-like n=1 Tax=Amphiura filiformis TaxID=82378 RepID=UPI003B212EA5
MNPFDDNVDDFVFVSKAKGSSASPWSDDQDAVRGNTGGWGGYDDDGFGRPNTSGFGADDDEEQMGYQNLQNQIQRRQENMLNSTHKSLGLMYEAEEVGNETAHELLRQGEQLQSTEKKLDQINADLTVSQKHINSIKSVFGGFKNYFSRKPDQSGTVEEPPRQPSKLESAVTKPPVDRTNQDEHPAFRVRDPNPPAADRYGEGYDSYGSGASGGGYDSGFGQPRQYSESRQQFDQKLDGNLDELSKGLGRLKDLGLGLTGELDKQEDDIERITGKAEKADDRIHGTNKQLQRILYK